MHAPRRRPRALHCSRATSTSPFHPYQAGSFIAFMGHKAEVRNLYDILDVPQGASNDDGMAFPTLLRIEQRR